jgi:hypothetical protein
MKEIENAKRCLEMIEYLMGNKRLGNAKHIRPYLHGLFEAVGAIQEKFMQDDEYTRLFTKAVKELNTARAHELRVTHHNDGGVVFDINALLPLEGMRPRFLMTGARNANTIQNGDGCDRPSKEDAARGHSDKPKAGDRAGKYARGEAVGGLRSSDDPRAVLAGSYADRANRAA